MLMTLQDAHCNITMGNDIARDMYCDVTMSNDVVYITMHNDVIMNHFYYVLLHLPMILLFFHTMNWFYVTQVRDLHMEITQASGDQSVRGVTHYDITMGNHIARYAHCDITMLLGSSIVMSQSRITLP